MKALSLAFSPTWWVKGRRKVRASPVLQTLLLVFMVLSTVTMMSVLSVPLMIGVGTPTMLTVDMAFRVNSYGDYAVANALGVVSLAICGALSWFYLRHSLQQKGGES